MFLTKRVQNGASSWKVFTENTLRPALFLIGNLEFLYFQDKCTASEKDSTAPSPLELQQ